MIYQNIYIIVPIISAIIAQILKFIIEGIMQRNFKLERIWGFGGMPSAHSALTISLCTLILLIRGGNSLEFAVAAIFTGIVLADAMGVRLETSKQAIALNVIVKNLVDDDKKISIKRLKEKVGHKPIEVIAGAVLGIIISIIAVQLNIFTY